MTARLRGAAHRLLTMAIRGRRAQGGVWGEALLAEFHETVGTREVLVWTLGGLRVAWRERRARFATLPRRARLLRRSGYALVVAALLAWPAQAFVATVVYAPSGGMQPSVHVGDRLLVDRVAFHLTGLHRGDIVVVRVTRDGVRSPALKRILGLPGDQISCTDGVLHRNGAVVPEPYLAPGAGTECPPTTVGPGQLFLLGDDRATSLDSRQYGTVAESAVLGRVLTRVWRDQI